MVFKNIILNGKKVNISVKNNIINKISCSDELLNEYADKNEQIIDCQNLVCLPALVDLHCHLREPGFEYKETVESGSLAARNGGFCAVLPMPNTKPCTDELKMIKDLLNKKSYVKLLPAAAVSIGQKGEEMTDLAALKTAGACAFSDDGMPIKSEIFAEAAMKKAKEQGVMLISHCENTDFVKDRTNIPSAAEYSMVERDCKLALKTQARLHIAHVSTKESIDIIRKAKAEGANISAETCPHYFSLYADEVKTLRGNAMMNPPLRFEEDAEAVINALSDGTIDIISTDHAPHSEKEKAGELSSVPFGIIGFETAFCVSYTHLVKTSYLSLERLCELMSFKPCEIIGIKKNEIKEGEEANFIVVDINSEFIYDVTKSFSKSRNSPFDKKAFWGKPIYSIYKGDVHICQY